MTDSIESTTANERMKSGFQGTMGGSLVVAVVLHILAFQFSPVWTADDWTSAVAAAVPIVRLDEIPIPVAPEPLRRPATPVAAPGVDVTTTLPTVSFSEAAELLPPPPSPTTTTAGSASALVVFSVAPELIDPEGFQRDLLRLYPAPLRDAGIGGTVVLHISIDETGTPTSATVATPSGYGQLDAAALQLSERMRFRPAMNRDQNVAVTVSIPIEFRVRR